MIIVFSSKDATWRVACVELCEVNDLNFKYNVNDSTVTTNGPTSQTMHLGGGPGYPKGSWSQGRLTLDGRLAATDVSYEMRPLHSIKRVRV